MPLPKVAAKGLCPPSKYLVIGLGYTRSKYQYGYLKFENFEKSTALYCSSFRANANLFPMKISSAPNFKFVGGWVGG